MQDKRPMIINIFKEILLHKKLQICSNKYQVQVKICENTKDLTISLFECDTKRKREKTSSIRKCLHKKRKRSAQR